MGYLCPQGPNLRKFLWVVDSQQSRANLNIPIWTSDMILVHKQGLGLHLNWCIAGFCIVSKASPAKQFSSDHHQSLGSFHQRAITGLLKNKGTNSHFAVICWKTCQFIDHEHLDSNLNFSTWLLALTHQKVG